MQNEIEWDFLNSCKSLGESVTGELFLLIESGAFSYSVLHRWGYRMHYPVAAIIKEKETATVIADMMGIFGSRLVNTNISPKVFMKELVACHDDVAVIVYLPGRYTEENMETLFGICTCGRIGDCEVSSPFLLVFQKMIPEVYRGRFSFIFSAEQKSPQILNRICKENFLIALKKYFLEKNQILKHKLRMDAMNHKLIQVKDGTYWNAVITVLESVFEEGMASENRCRMRRRFETAVKKGYDSSDAYEYIRQMPAAFVEEFIAFIPYMERMINKANATALTGERQKRTVLFDEEYYYIPEELFAQICEPLKAVCSLNQIKEALEKEGVLCTQGRGRIYRTIKLSIRGTDVSPRFVWLKRKKLDTDCTEMTLEDRVNCRKVGK